MIVSTFIALVVIGVLLYCVLQIPMPAPIGNIVLGLGILVCVLYVMQAFGLWHGMPLPRG